MTGKQLQSMRHKAGLSTAGLARLLTCSRRTVEDWEQGRRAVPPIVECCVTGVCPTCQRAGALQIEAFKNLPQKKGR
jgi:DNA-binding XRE family transcriptional regulator